MELDKILDEMESILSDGWRVPFVNKVMIDENEITMVMDKLRAAVPLEVKRAHDLLEEQKNINGLSVNRQPVFAHVIIFGKLFQKNQFFCNFFFFSAFASQVSSTPSLRKLITSTSESITEVWT